MSRDDKVNEEKKTFQLSSEQLDAIKYIVEEQGNTIISGVAGTGKSKLLDELIQRLNLGEKSRHTHVGVTASTGTAALRISGTTLHSWSGVKLGEGNIGELFELVCKNKKAASRWRNCTTLIIDEISMISGHLFDKLNSIAQLMRNNELPFGGIQVVMVGDFLQLPCVSPNAPPVMCFESKCWNSLNIRVIQLTRVFRQQDVEFAKCLGEIRQGIVTPETRALLQKCVNRKFDEKDLIKPTILYPKRREVDAENQKELQKLTSPSVFYNAQDDEDRNMKGYMNKHSPVPTKLELKVGAQVMLVKNLKIEDGLVNGSRGVVTKLTQANVTVKFLNNIERVIGRDRWEVTEEKEVVASRCQIPLILASAISIHKSQGASLDRVCVDLRSIFEDGQAYTALSRCRSLDGLSIIQCFPIHSITTNQKALEFYQNLSGPATLNTAPIISNITAVTTHLNDDGEPNPKKQKNCPC